MLEQMGGIAMDLEQIYDRFDEEKRLNNGRNSSRVEFLTTTH